MFSMRNYASLLVLVLVVVVLAGCSDTSSNAARLEAPSALAVPVEQLREEAGYDQVRLFTGRVEASRRSEVGFDQGGELVEVLVDEGDLVAAGDVIALLDTARLLARRNEARAALDQARAQSELAAATRSRIAEALQFNAVTAQDYDEADSGLMAARAAVVAAQARLDSVAVDLDKMVLTAPYDAVVTRRLVDEGQILAAGQPLVALQEIAEPRIRVGVAGDSVDAVRIGRSYPLLVAGHEIAATASAVLPVRDDVARTVDVLFDVEPGQAHAVRAGDLARLSLHKRIDEPGYWVPLDALAEGSRGLWSNYVLVPDDDDASGATHAVEVRAVDVLYQDARHAYVRGALEAGDMIVSGGLHRIVPGQGVRIREQRVSSRSTAQ